ncbi:MAG: membrane protein insertion efficiency factor YidD [Chloroflexi bacterium]|nr:membrane protein insertion efficiency factor YidD [Chloroflexota bacterium]
MRGLMLAAIRFYQRSISVQTGPTCRYHPTCSQYAYEAIDRHGPWRGVWLAACRLGRCHPGRAGGYDPVPPRRGGHEAHIAAEPAARHGPGGEPEESKAH